MGEFKYITNRTLENKSGQEAGRIKAAVRNNSNQVEGIYSCPECKADGKINQPFKRPLSVRCVKCNYLMKLPKLKGKK